MKKKLFGGRDCSIFKGIGSPIEQGARYSGKGEPWAVEKGYVLLNNRQQALLDKLPGYDSRVTVRKSDVSMSDLAALTAKTRVEYAMFTRGPERLVVRGDRRHVNISLTDAAEMRARGYRWSGHTHTDTLVESAGDKAVLGAFGQDVGVIYNSVGNHRLFKSF